MRCQLQKASVIVRFPVLFMCLRRQQDPPDSAAIDGILQQLQDPVDVIRIEVRNDQVIDPFDAVIFQARDQNISSDLILGRRTAVT